MSFGRANTARSDTADNADTPCRSLAETLRDVTSQLAGGHFVRVAQGRDARRQITAAVTASQTTVTEVFGVGPLVAAAVIGDVGDISRFGTRDHFAAYDGTAPIEVSSGGRRKVRSRRGNRRLNHAIHMAAALLKECAPV